MIKNILINYKKKNNNDKKSIYSFLLKLFLTFACIFTLYVPAFANTVSNMTINVLVHDSGSATITQKWVGTFNEGTEVYIPIDDTTLNISNLQVEMNKENENIKFENVADWDVNSDFDEKAYKSGINTTSKGVELCFGLSSYGNNTYTFSYDVDPLVWSLRDYDGFNFQFVNPNMSTFPTAIDSWTLKLENAKELNTDNARIWGFGFDGETYIENGVATAKSNVDLEVGNSLIIMMRLDKGLIKPLYNKEINFEEVKDKAFIGSSYSEEEADYNRSIRMLQIIIAVVLILFISVSLFIVIIKVKRINQLKQFYKRTNFFRDIPNKGNMLITNALCSDFNIWNISNGNIIGALIMKMINDKNIEPYQDKEVGLFGIEKKSTSLVLVSEPKDVNAKSLYSILSRAAGQDHILQEKELKKYCATNYAELLEYINNVEGEGRRLLNAEGGYVRILGNRLKDLTPTGQKELSEAYGLRKYLDEFTLIHERGIFEIKIWESLLIYATLFGLAKKVLQDLKNVYPEHIEALQEYNDTIMISDIYCASMYSSAINAMRNSGDSRFSGMGGSSSIGGGGGFSGGGSGGGTR